MVRYSRLRVFGAGLLIAVELYAADGERQLWSPEFMIREFREFEFKSPKRRHRDARVARSCQYVGCPVLQVSNSGRRSYDPTSNHRSIHTRTGALRPREGLRNVRAK